MVHRSASRLVLVAAAVMSCGAEDESAVAGSAIIKGPYLQHMTPHEVTILWETRLPTVGRVNLQGAEGATVAASEVNGTIHEVRIADRSPAEELTYSVEATDDTGALSTSTAATFRMAPEPGTPFRLCLWGDSQERPEVFSQLVAHMVAAEPDLVVGLGDYVTSGSIYAQWGERLFTPLQPLIQHTPLIAALGNHDEGASWFFDLLAQPGNEQWFSYRYGNAFFLVLDTNEPFAVGTEQYAYALDALLSDEAQSATWLFVVHHHPPYSEIWEEPIYAAIRAELIPLYEHAGVDVNFHGHIHDYERGLYVPPATGRRIAQVQTSGGGGTLWWDDYDGDWEQIDLVIMNEYHVVEVQVGEAELELRAVNLAGDPIDAFTLTAESRAGQPPPTP